MRLIVTGELVGIDIDVDVDGICDSGMNTLRSAHSATNKVLLDDASEARKLDSKNVLDGDDTADVAAIGIVVDVVIADDDDTRSLNAAGATAAKKNKKKKKNRCALKHRPTQTVAGANLATMTTATATATDCTTRWQTVAGLAAPDCTHSCHDRPLVVRSAAINKRSR